MECKEDILYTIVILNALLVLKSTVRRGTFQLTTTTAELAFPFMGRVGQCTAPLLD